MTPFPPPVDSYHDGDGLGLWGTLVHRVQGEPFNLIATVIFLLAVVHTFFAPTILRWAHQVQHGRELAIEEGVRPARRSIRAAVLHVLGEVEVIFALWVIPLALALGMGKGFPVARIYFVDTVRYTTPLFVVVIMAVAASRPIVQLAERSLALLAGRSPARWWIVLLTLGPLLGSLITEPAAMTLCALLLGREFYRLGPSPRFMYATLGLLFVNISVGGAFTNFAAPPVLMVAGTWGWSSAHMFGQFGFRALGGILVGNAAYFLIFRKEFTQWNERNAPLRAGAPSRHDNFSFGVTGVHLAFLAWTVFTADRPVFFLAGFVLFVAFTFVTKDYQDRMDLKAPFLVGLFLAGLVIHGGLQGWWIEPVLSRLSRYPLLLGATALTAFNDNAAITYLATLVPGLNDPLRVAVVAGAISGGGLTVIANAPNPAGQFLLQKYFPEKSISPGGLFLAALGPTLVMLLFFAFPSR
jgi:hypothetical protein